MATKKKAKKAKKAKTAKKPKRSAAQKAATARMIAARKASLGKPSKKAGKKAAKKAGKKRAKKAPKKWTPKAYKVKKNPKGGQIPLSVLEARSNYLDRLIYERSR